MSAKQTIYEMTMRLKDPDQYKEHMKAKMAFEDGDDNAVEGDDSYQGRTTSGGVGGLDVKSYAMKSDNSDEPSADRQGAKERAQKFMMDGTEGSDFTAV